MKIDHCFVVFLCYYFLSRFSDVLVYLYIVFKVPTKTAKRKIGTKGPAKEDAKGAVPKSRSKSGIVIHLLYLKCMQKSW